MQTHDAACLDAWPEVRQVLESLLLGVQSALGGNFTGLYLYGSLAIGGFDPRTSDIDFLVVTAAASDSGQTAALDELHARLLSRHPRWAGELEGSYIPADEARRYDPQRSVHLHLERGAGRLVAEQHDTDWIIQRHVLHEHGVALAGPPARELIDPVAPADLRQALVALMRGWWAPMVHDTARLQPLDYRCYAVQTMCRMLYTLEHGTIVPKRAAAQWATAALDASWSALIDWSFTWPRVERPGTLAETCALIKYVGEYCD
jgi:predicted nucleotidyltransferase